MEVASDLVRLALFDVILYLDDSGSMAFEENGTRIGELGPGSGFSSSASDNACFADDMKLVVSKVIDDVRSNSDSVLTSPVSGRSSCLAL